MLERLEPERWTLEWYLPWWLGRAFGLDAVTAIDLVLSNVLGLASIRLQDDLADGEVAPDEVPATTALSTDLYRLALQPYRTRFADSSPFWAHVEGWMSAWRDATDRAADRTHASRINADDGSLQALASRGAPLKIPAYAICALTGRVDAFRTLDLALDHALAGLVLYDHIGDWRMDLAACRWNAFIAAVSDLPQDPGSRDRNRVAVHVAMLTGAGVETYVTRITSELARAATLFEAMGISPLVGYIRTLAAAIRTQGATWQAHNDVLAELAGRLMLDAPLRDPSGDALAASVTAGV